MKVTWNDIVLAESDDTEVVEGNHYFPPASINREYFQKSDTQYTCPWKGDAGYYHVAADENRAEDAAWYYPDPKEEARQIKDHVAFDAEKVTVTE